MQYVGKVLKSVSEFYREINPSTLSGAIDIIVAERSDGTLACTPFHVRFGKFQLLRPSEKVVDLFINGKPVDFHMKLGDAGEAFFVIETEQPVPLEFATSPIAEPAVGDVEPDYLDLGDYGLDDGVDTTSGPRHNDGYVSAVSDHESVDSASVAPDSDASETGRGEFHPYTLPAEAGQPRASTERRPPLKRTSTEARRPRKPFTHRDINIRDDSLLLDTVGYKLRNDVAGGPATVTPHRSGADDLPDFRDKRQRSRARLTGLRHDVKSDDEYSTPYPSADTERGTGYFDDHVRGGHTDRDPQEAGRSSWRWGWNQQVATAPAAETTTTTRANPNDAVRIDVQSSASDSAADSTDSSSQLYNSSVPSMASEPPAAALESDRPRIELSFCGWRALSRDAVRNAQLFDSHCVPYAQFAADPHTTLANQALVVRAQGQYYTWPNVGPLLVSLMAYGKPVDLPSIDTLAPVQSQPPTPTHARPGRRPTSGVQSDPGEGNEGDTEDEAESTPRPTRSGGGGGYSLRRPWQWWSRNSVATRAAPAPSGTGGGTSRNVTTDDTGKSSIDDFPGRAPAARAHTLQHARSESELIDQRVHHDDLHIDLPMYAAEEAEAPAVDTRHYAKTLRLTSDQLKEMGLQYGANTVTFMVRTALSDPDDSSNPSDGEGAPADITGNEAGEAEIEGSPHTAAGPAKRPTAATRPYCSAKIFYLKPETQLVISDIDGTITKSDALGHIFTMVGKDWTHIGVAKLYTDITQNGYQIMYLTSRAIGQADATRDYLRGVTQGPFRLPDGPVIMSPDRLFESFHREVIARQPQVFKMACLRDVRGIFGDRNPFYAGFGNRITDALSYRSVNVPTSRIFTIDYSGDVKLELLMSYRSSYLSLNSLVDQIFPPVAEKIATEYNDWAYWKPALPNIESLPEEIEEAPPAKSSKADVGSGADQETTPGRVVNTRMTDLAEDSAATTGTGGTGILADLGLTSHSPSLSHVADKASTSSISVLSPGRVLSSAIPEALRSAPSSPGPSPPTSTGKAPSKRRSVISRVANLGGLLPSLNRGATTSATAPDASANLTAGINGSTTTTVGNKPVPAGNQPSASTPHSRTPSSTSNKPATIKRVTAPNKSAGVAASQATHAASGPKGKVPVAPSPSAPLTVHAKAASDSQLQPAGESPSTEKEHTVTHDEAMFNEYLETVDLSPEIDLNEFSYL